MDKKYQIFISSTFTDLIDERQGIIQAILGLYHIPIGMEMFSAEDEDQWEIIRRTIDVSDYYVLILGLRYGSKTSEDISYTQKEYEYALEKGIPILTFIMNDDVAVPQSKRDDDLADIKKFRTVAKTNNKMVQFWSTKDELVKNVSIALMMQIMQKPRIGWIRGNNAENNQELSLELVRLSKENRELKNQLKAFEVDQPKIEISYDENQNIEIQTYRLPTKEEISSFKDYLQQVYPQEALELCLENDSKFHNTALALNRFSTLSNRFKGITEEEIIEYNSKYNNWLNKMSYEDENPLIHHKTACFKKTFSIKNIGSTPAQNLYVRIFSDDKVIFSPYITDEELENYRLSNNINDLQDCYKAIQDNTTVIFIPPPEAPKKFSQNNINMWELSRKNYSSDLASLAKRLNPPTHRENNNFYYCNERPQSPTACIELECPKFFHHNKHQFSFYFIIPENYNKNSICFTIEIQAENLRNITQETIEIKIENMAPVSILEHVSEEIKNNLL